MSLRLKLLQAAAVLALAASPASYLPSLALHGPTVAAAPSPGHPGDSPSRFPLELVGLVGAIRIKDTASIAKKFVQRAGSAAPEYSTGVQGAGQDWQTNTLNGKDNYVQGVQDAIARGAFERGVGAAGAQKYVDNATKLGPQRYQTGVAQAENAYSRGVQPHLDMMKGLDLPPKGPKGSAQNQQRANIVATRNRALKLGK